MTSSCSGTQLTSLSLVSARKLICATVHITPPPCRHASDMPAVCCAAADGLPHMGSPVRMALQPSLPSANPSHERNFRQLSAGAGTGPGSGTSSALAQIDAAQLLPRGIHSLYAQNPGALLGSGQAAGMALGRGHAHNSLSSGFNSSTGPMTGGAARFLAGLNMNTVPPPSAFPLCRSKCSQATHEGTVRPCSGRRQCRHPPA